MGASELIDVRPISGADLQIAALVAARGMRDNPLHVAALGPNPERRVRVMQRLFARLLPVDGRPTIGAWDRARLVGIAGSAEPGRCQPSARDSVKLAPALIMAGTSIGRMSRWIWTWSKHDPSRSHSHLGPLAVDLDRQGQGIGSALLGEYCKRIDTVGMASYLETDKTENVRLYERFGFAVTGEANVIGVKNWFMMREPATS